MQPFSIFSDGFAAIAFSQYALAANDDRARTIASEAYQNYMQRRDNPKGSYSKACPGGPPMLDLSLRMIHINMLLEMAWQLDSHEAESEAQGLIDEVMNVFLDPGCNVLFENVCAAGTHPDIPAGRMINPGHGVEVLWMALAAAQRWNRGNITDKIVDAMAMAYACTGREDCLRWLVTIDQYINNHYVDPDHGEWFGYLNRRGERLLDIKGGRWKGCFHVPRALLLAWKYLENTK